MTTKGSFLLVCCFVLILGLLSGSNGAKKKRGSRYFIKIMEFYDCPGQYSTSIVNVTKNYTGEGINGFFVVNDDHFPSKLVVFFDAKKCTTLHDSNCEPYISGVLDWCKMIVDKGQFYTPFFSAFHPPLVCPMKKEIHVIQNATMSYHAMENFLKYIPAEFHHVFWKLNLKVTPPGKPEKIKACYNIVFKYFSKRTKY